MRRCHHKRIRLSIVSTFRQSIEPRHVRAVYTIGEREQLALALQPELFGFGEEFLNHGFVLLRFEGTGGIDKDAAGFHAGGGASQKAELEFSEAVDFRGLDAPAQVDAPAQNTGVRAGNVDEDAVEGRPAMKRRDFPPHPSPLPVGRGEGGERRRDLLPLPL